MTKATATKATAAATCYGYDYGLLVTCKATACRSLRQHDPRAVCTCD
jgi:hypothetical protein